MWAYGLLILAALVQVSTGVIDCSNRRVCDPQPRRILFILDASLSISEGRFNSEMMDYITSVMCAFTNYANGAKYEAGVTFFNQYNEVVIPFEEFTPETFEARVNANVRNKVPLRCCTTHAEAAILAAELFTEAKARDDLNGESYENIAFFVTDGVPYINYWSGTYSVPKSKRSKFFYSSRGLDLQEWTQGDDKGFRGEERVYYATKLVPEAMKALKDDDIRVFFIGVPHKNPEKNVNIDYFTGKLPGLEVCYENSDVNPAITNCGIMEYSPLVSEPVDDHAFRVETWDMEPLITQTLDIICKQWVPPSPTAATTPQPTPQPIPPSAGTPEPTPPTPEPTPLPTTSNCNPIPRDLMVLVDTSESMDPDRYRDEMMQVVKTAASSLDFASGSRIGVATFGWQRNTRIVIPLQNFEDISDFETMVDELVAPIEPHCCTNFAEAFRMVREHFSATYKHGQDKILLITTDGTPFQNYGRDRWEWQGAHPRRNLNRCEYAIDVVPEQAENLRNDGVRIVLAGVPNVYDRPTMEDYFTGSLEGSQCCVNIFTNKACLKDQEQLWCSNAFEASEPTKCYDYQGRSITTPGENNIFSTRNWDLTEINQGIRNMICFSNAQPTNPPTPKPTAKPIEEGGSEATDPPVPASPTVEGFDLVVILDTSVTDSAQQARCKNNGSEQDCINQLVNFANRVRGNLYDRTNTNDMGFATISGNCYRSDIYNQRNPWAKREDHHISAIRDLRDSRQKGDQKCLTSAFMKATDIITARSDQTRPVAVLVLVHDSSSFDTCTYSTLASSLRGDSNIQLYAASVGELSGAHRNELVALTGNSQRVFNAFSDFDGLTSMLETRLKK